MRAASHPIEPIFLQRVSTRAFSGDPLATPDLMRLLEAARWAPSSSNGQPWRFVWALGKTPAFERFFAALAPGNQTWCARAGALLVLCAKDTFDSGRPNPHHLFDPGAAWMSLALQATHMGLVAHGMAGFDRDRAAEAVKLPPGHAVICMIAIGYPGPIEALPEPLRARETPSDRKPLEQTAFEGEFPAAPEKGA